MAGLYPAYGARYANKFLRSWLVATHGEKCSKCGWAQINTTLGRCPVEVDHVDGDWRNNSPDNVRLLCPNCHALTLRFRALNRGRGRELGRVTEPPADAPT
ncbi:MAG: HNH endonuclease [Candidatus Eremiobacteraeota bacterium]|nr:HNH endonuclease [Candidatus Eremiobacteraeota bacterium]